MKLLCWLKGIWRTISRPGFYEDGIPVSGHNLVELEEHDNVTVIVDECKECKEIHISWKK